MGEEKELLTVREAAEAARFSERTITDACKSGKLKAWQRPPRGHWRIPVDELHRWIEGKSRQPEAGAAHPKEAATEDRLTEAQTRHDERKSAAVTGPSPQESQPQARPPVADDPLMQEARRKHFEDLCGVIERFVQEIVNLEDFVYEMNSIETSAAKSRLLQEDDGWHRLQLEYSSEYYELDEGDADSIKPWVRLRVQAGKIAEIELDIETAEPLFACLRSHLDESVRRLDGEWKLLLGQIWESELHGWGTMDDYLELLSRTIDKSDSLKKRLTLARHRRVFSGKCEVCAEYAREQSRNADDTPIATGRDPLLLEARREHIRDVCSLIERLERAVSGLTCFNWDKLFGNEDAGNWVAPIDAAQDDDFTATELADAKCTRREEDGHLIELSYGIEKHPLFACLRNHMDEEAWRLYEDWRKLEWELQQASSWRESRQVDMLRQHEQLRDKILVTFGRIRHKRMLPGICECCP